SATGKGAMQEAVEAAIQAEQKGTLADSIFAGFALSDIPRPWLSVVVVAQDNEDEAVSVAQSISTSMWKNRAGFIYHSEPLAQSIAQAAKLASQERDKPKKQRQPVLLMDHSDNCMSGGTCDVMDVLEEALHQGLQDIAVGPICDPEAVETLI